MSAKNLQKTPTPKPNTQGKTTKERIKKKTVFIPDELLLCHFVLLRDGLLVGVRVEHDDGEGKHKGRVGIGKNARGILRDIHIRKRLYQMRKKERR
jgi:hypothetical protein